MHYRILEAHLISEIILPNEFQIKFSRAQSAFRSVASRYMIDLQLRALRVFYILLLYCSTVHFIS